MTEKRIDSILIDFVFFEKLMEELKLEENDHAENKLQKARKWTQYLAALVGKIF